MNKISLISVFSLFCIWAWTQESTETKAIVENYGKFPPNEAVRCILIDKKNYKWLGTDKGLYRMVSLDIEPEVITKDSVCGLAEDKRETVWYGNRQRTLISEDLSQKIELGINGQISCMAYYNGDIWVGTNQGLYRVSDDQSKVLKHFTKENSKLSSNVINMLYKDQENKLWIGTDEGVNILDKLDWSRAWEQEHKIVGAINTTEGVWLLGEKKMWLIYKEDGHTRWQDAAVKRGLSKGPVRALAADSKGRIYVASEILVQFDPYTDKAFQIDQDYGFVSSQSLSLACDRNDDLWVGTADRGLFRVDILDGEAEKFSAVAFSKGEIKCPDDKTASIIVVVKGGRTPYRYTWSIPDVKGTRVDSLGIGTYAVTVTDAEGEEYVASVPIKGPDQLKIDILSKDKVTEVNKKDGKANINISGGTAPYRILWDNGKTTSNVTNLSSGKHTVRIADQNQCQKTAEVYIEQPKVLPELDRAKIAVGQTLRINELYFSADSAVISSESFLVMDEIYTFLKANPSVIIEIGGHTNSTPSEEYCDRLSTGRAKNVAEYLYNKGIQKEQISYKGYGKRVPVASNETLAGRQKNQRVEIKIIAIN